MKMVPLVAIGLLLSCSKNTEILYTQTEPLTYAVLFPILPDYDPEEAAKTCMATTSSWGACFQCAYKECVSSWKCAYMCAWRPHFCAGTWAVTCAFGNMASRAIPYPNRKGQPWQGPLTPGL